MGIFSSKESGTPVLFWQKLTSESGPRHTCRAKIPGGWLLAVREYGVDGIGAGVTFIPDPNHEWDGNSI
jgi:hypothetical protein